MDNLTQKSWDTEAPVDKEAVFLQLKRMVTEIIGEDAAEIVGVQKDSTFIKDLEMDSIQIVAFAEMVQEQYGHQVDFVRWLSKKSILKLIGLTVGDVAALIEKGN